MVTFTVDRYGKPGMPTFNIRKVRKLLKSGRAEIFCYHPFTVKLLYAEALDTQPVEICLDTGDRHIGVSVKSEKHEFAHAQYDPLDDEKKRHDDRRRYRRTRRSRLRHRKPRFANRRREKGWIAPTVEHKKDLHISIVKRYMRVCPIAHIVAEVGTFDTQLLEAMESGGPLPEGTDYQHGKQYMRNTRRDAVFYRDGYKCLLCGSTEGPFRVHHIGYWKGDHSNRMENLATLCVEKCHIPANHQKGGKLWGWKPKIKPMAGAAFMNTVRWKITGDLKEETGLPVTTTYGSMTKTMRKFFCIDKKTHANDAFVMGEFYPKHRQKEIVYKKRRRNNRILSKFYDATYKDTRDGKVKKGQELPCGRTNRKEPRHSEKDLRPFRGHKVKKGYVSVRKQRYPIQPGTVLLYKGKKYKAKGVHNKGTRVILDSGKSVAIKKVTIVSFPDTWERVFVKRKEDAGQQKDRLS